MFLYRSEKPPLVPKGTKVGPTENYFSIENYSLTEHAISNLSEYIIMNIMDNIVKHHGSTNKIY